MEANSRQSATPLAMVPAVDEAAQARQTKLPLKLSPDKRYFVDQQGRPIFSLGTTQWELFRLFTLEEARLILEKCAARGLTFIQVKLMGRGDGSGPNLGGHAPWLNNDPRTPNEGYFKNVDAVMNIAAEYNITIVMVLFHQLHRKFITVENARIWAEWLARRYSDMPHIIWSMTPQAKPEFVPILQELAAGLKQVDGDRHLICVKPDPGPFSSSSLPSCEFTDYHCIQTWKNVASIYPLIRHDYNLQPRKPVVMMEGAYESGSEYGFEVTPLWVRRQAYYSYLAGAGHSYGHNDSWRVLPEWQKQSQTAAWQHTFNDVKGVLPIWKKALDAPGLIQMGVLKRIFLARKQWWRLVPDQSLFAAGGQTEGTLLHLAARHEDGTWAIVYLADPARFSVHLDKLAPGAMTGLWIHPETGESQSVRVSTGTQEFSTPTGWEDSLLVLEPMADQGGL